MVKPALPFGLNVWNRNHFNIFRRAQWPWAEQTMYADWVKPITYQHQAGEIWHKEFGFFQKDHPARPPHGRPPAMLAQMLASRRHRWTR